MTAETYGPELLSPSRGIMIENVSECPGQAPGPGQLSQVGHSLSASGPGPGVVADAAPPARGPDPGAGGHVANLDGLGQRTAAGRADRPARACRGTGRARPATVLPTRILGMLADDACGPMPRSKLRDTQSMTRVCGWWAVTRMGCGLRHGAPRARRHADKSGPLRRFR